MHGALEERPSQEDYDRLMELCDGLCGLSDSEAFFGGGRIDVPGGSGAATSSSPPL